MKALHIWRALLCVLISRARKDKLQYQFALDCCRSPKLTCATCVDVTKDLVNDLHERRGGVDDDAVFWKVFLRVMQAHNDFPFLRCSAPISGVQCYALSNPPETGIQVDLKDKHAV